MLSLDGTMNLFKGFTAGMRHGLCCNTLFCVHVAVFSFYPIICNKRFLFNCIKQDFSIEKKPFNHIFRFKEQILSNICYLFKLSIKKPNILPELLSFFIWLLFVPNKLESLPACK